MIFFIFNAHNNKKQNLMQKVFLLLLLCSTGYMLQAQPDRWQQRVKYTMDVNVDVNTNRFSGRQRLEYTNNSPDTLGRV